MWPHNNKIIFPTLLRTAQVSDVRSSALMWSSKEEHPIKWVLFQRWILFSVLYIFCWHKHHRVSTKNFDANAEKELNSIRDYIGSSWNKDCVVCHFLYNFLHYFWSGIKNYLKNLNYQWWHNRERGVNNWQVSEVGRRLC